MSTKPQAVQACYQVTGTRVLLMVHGGNFLPSVKSLKKRRLRCETNVLYSKRVLTGNVPV